MSEYIDKYYQEQINIAINNILWAELKNKGSPCASYQHMATAIEILHKLVPNYKPKDEECKYLFTELLTNQDILHGKISCDIGLEIMDELDIYNSRKEI